MSDSKWINNVGQICTWQKWEEIDGELEMVRDWKTIEIIKEFSGLYKNRMNLVKYAENLEKLLEKEKISMDDFNKKMMYDIQKSGDFKPKKPGNYKFISHVINCPPQTFRESPKDSKFKNDSILEIRQGYNKNNELEPFIMFSKDVDFKLEKDKDGKNKPLFINLNNEVEKINYWCSSGKITEEERDAKLKVYEIEGTDQYWMLFRGFINNK